MTAREFLKCLSDEELSMLEKWYAAKHVECEHEYYVRALRIRNAFMDCDANISVTQRLLMLTEEIVDRLEMKGE